MLHEHLQISNSSSMKLFKFLHSNDSSLRLLEFKWRLTFNVVELNKRSPNEVARFWGRSMLKLNLERIVEIPEQIFLVQNFTGDLMAERPILNSYLSGVIQEWKREKSRNVKFASPLVEFCRVNTGVKLVWIPGVRFDTGVWHRCYTHLFRDRARFTRVNWTIYFK